MNAVMGPSSVGTPGIEASADERVVAALLDRGRLKDADLVVSFACDAGRKLAPGKAEERWDECPAVSDDFDVAWDFITGRVEKLIGQLATA